MGIYLRNNIKKTLQRSQAHIMNDLTDSLGLAKADHWVTNATAPTIAVTTAGDGACALASTSTDVCGTLTFSDTWADGDTVVLTYATAYETAPLVFFFSCGEVGADGKFDIEVDTVASATTAFTLTESGTCVGVTQYLVIEAV